MFHRGFTKFKAIFLVIFVVVLFVICNELTLKDTLVRGQFKKWRTLSTHPPITWPLLPWFFQHGSLRPSKDSNKTLRVWPEEDASDRIVEQLMLTAEAFTIKTIHVDTNAFKVPLGRKWFTEAECPVDTCEFVSADMGSADAVLFKDNIKNSRRGVPSSQIWILYILENPYVSGLTDGGNVNWTATYRSDSEVVAPYEKWVYYKPNVRQIKNRTKNYAEGKTKQVAWFVSNCHAKNNRMEYANELKKYIDVDVYGRCGDKSCPRSKAECQDMLRTTYKFYLAFENGNCREYITEKFFVNALGNDILPIAMGAHPDDYKALAPEHSFIHVEDFPSPRDLADYLKLLDSDDDLYNSYFHWKGTGEFINTRFFCRVCALLHTNRTDHSYPSFRSWWRDGACRSDPWIT